MAGFRARPIFAEEGEDDSSFVPVFVPMLGTVAARSASTAAAAPPQYCDVYPVLETLVELRLDKAAVTSGYAERKQPYEFASCITGNAEPLRSSATPTPMLGDPAQLSRMLGKVRQSLALLRRSRPAKLQRVELGAVARLHAADVDKKRVLFPLQKPYASASLDDWFSRLAAGGAFCTAEAATAVPLGSSIVRAAGRVLEMMAVHAVPTQRAAWYIRIAVLNECVKQVRPDRPPPKPRDFWTRQLCHLLKQELDTIRARRVNTLGNMDRLAFWNYVLDLARWQADEALLDVDVWLKKVCFMLRVESGPAPALNSMGGKICVAALQRFIPHYLLDRSLRTALKDNLIVHAAYVLGAAHASCVSSNGRRSSRAPQHTPLTSTNSQAAFNKATFAIAALFGCDNPSHRRLLTNPPKKFSAAEAIESALDLTSPTAAVKDWVEQEAAPKAAPTKQQSRMVADKLCEFPPDQLSTLDVTAALERFPIAGNAHVLRVMMRGTFANRGGDRAAVEHVCKWAISAKSFHTSLVVATAASAIDILAQAAGQRSLATRKSVPKLPPNSIDTLPTFHREIWLFLKELADDEERNKEFGAIEEREEDRRVAALIARLCRVGVFSLTAFVRDVTRIPNYPPMALGRLVRYVQLLPEPHERVCAEARRQLLRRHGLLPPQTQQATCTAALEQILVLVRAGDELRCIAEGVKLSSKAELGVALAIVAGVVDEFSDTQQKAPEKVTTSLNALVCFLRAAGASALAADFLLTTLTQLVTVATQSGTRSQALNAAIVTCVECLPHLAPVLAATNQIVPAMSALVRVWNVPASNAAMQRIRASTERTALMIGKYFCSCSPSEHEHWKQLVVSSLTAQNFANLKNLFCGLSAGVQPIVMEKQQALANLQIFSTKSTQVVRNGASDKVWMGQGIDKLMESTKMQLRKTLITKMAQVDVERFYKELRCVNHVMDGVFIPVLRVSQKLSQVPKGDVDAYKNVVDNIANILSSPWITALADEIRPYSLIEVVALLLVGAMANYNGAREALAKAVTLPWVRHLFALHAGRLCFERLARIVRENLPRAQFDDATVNAEVCATTAALHGAGAQIEAGGIVSGVTVRPAGVTQMLFCAALALSGTNGTSAEFPGKAAAVVVASGSSAETTVLSRMLLKCYDDGSSRTQAAAEVAQCAVQAMQQSAHGFITGVTAQTDEHDDLNQQRATEWLMVDEARRAMLAVSVPHIAPSAAAAIAAQLAVQATAFAQRVVEASATRHIPRLASPTGKATADALDARAKLMLVSAKGSLTAVDKVEVATAATHLLAATAYLLPSHTVEYIVELISICATDPAVGEQLRGIASPARPFLERTQWAAFMRATGSPLRPQPLHRAVEARGASGDPLDNWYLLEGYGTRVGEEAALPPEAFDRQQETDREEEALLDGKQSVRLKRTYSTFACLVR